MDKPVLLFSKNPAIILAVALSLVAMPVWSAGDGSMASGHNRMQKQDNGNTNMPNGMGMMGQGGMGMMGTGISSMMNMPGLDKKQRAKIRGLMREQRNSCCKSMNVLMDIKDELATQYDQDVLDAKAIGKTYGKLFDIKRRMIEQSIVMQNKIRDILNKQQRQMFDQMHHNSGMMGGGMGMMDR